jgi:hypothetical protein
MSMLASQRFLPLFVTQFTGLPGVRTSRNRRVPSLSGLLQKAPSTVSDQMPASF